LDINAKIEVVVKINHENHVIEYLIILPLVEHWRREIRTLDTFNRIHTFQACFFSHSDISTVIQIVHCLIIIKVSQTKFDAETRFQLCTERGQGKEVRGLDLRQKPWMISNVATFR